MELPDFVSIIAYPLPWIDDTLDMPAGSKWFSTLNMISGYWIVEIRLPFALSV